MSLKIHNHFKNEKSTARIETHTGFDELLEYASLDSTYLFDDVLDELSKYYDYVDDAFDEEQAANDPEFIIKKEGGDERADYYTEDIFYVHLPSKEAAEELADILDGKLEESTKSEAAKGFIGDAKTIKEIVSSHFKDNGVPVTIDIDADGHDVRAKWAAGSMLVRMALNNGIPVIVVRSTLNNRGGYAQTYLKDKDTWESDLKNWLKEHIDSTWFNPRESKKESNMNAHKFGTKSESSRYGSGMSSRKDFSKSRNLGDIFDVLDAHRKLLKDATQDMKKSKEDLKGAIKRLEEFEKNTDFLKQQSVKGIKKAIAVKNSPEVQASGEVIDALKNVISIVAADYANIPDVKQLMTVIDSRYATRGSQILTTLEGQVSRAIEVDMKTLQDSIDNGDVSEDDIMKFVTATTVTHGVQNKGVVEKVAPILDKMNAMVAASSKMAEAVIDPKQFQELRDLVEQIVTEAAAPKDSFRTTITALDKGTIASIPTESKVSEGLLDKLKEVVSAIKDKISMLWDSFTSLFFSIEDEALESADVFSEVEVSLALVGVEVYESHKSENLGKQFEVLTKSVLTCCDNLVKDASLAGEFDDEVIYAEDAVKNAVESFQHLGEACKTLKSVLSHHKNEDNMDVIGILADAITQIVADDAGEDGEESGEGDDGGESVIDQIENEYSPMGGEETEEPAGEPSPVEPGEPEEF